MPHHFPSHFSLGMSRSLESVMGFPQNGSQGGNGNFVQRTNERKQISTGPVHDIRRFSDASGMMPPPRPPPPNIKRLKHQNVICDRRLAGNPSPPSWLFPPPSPNLQFQPQQQTKSVSNLTKMAHLAKSSPQLDSNVPMEKEREKEREKEKEKLRERYPPQQIQVDKENLKAQVSTFSFFLLFFLNKPIDNRFKSYFILHFNTFI